MKTQTGRLTSSSLLTKLGIVLIAVAMFSTSAFAAGPQGKKGQQHFPEFHGSQKQLERPQLTEEQKEILEQLKELKESGDKELVKEYVATLPAELQKILKKVKNHKGLQKGGPKDGHGRDNLGGIMRAVKFAIHAAGGAESFDAWADALAKKGVEGEFVNETVYSKMVKISDLKEAQETEAARELMKELRELLRGYFGEDNDENGQ